MKNKLVITILALTMTAAMFAGCGKETAEVQSADTETVAEISTEKAVVVETETEESTEGAELVYNTETEAEVVAKGEKTIGTKSEKTDSKKADTTGSAKSGSQSGNSTSTSTGSVQSSGNSATNNSSSTGVTSAEIKTASTSSDNKSGGDTASGTTAAQDTNTTPSQPEQTQEERIFEKVLEVNPAAAQEKNPPESHSSVQMVKWVMNNYGLSEDQAIAVYADYNNKLCSEPCYYAYDLYNMDVDPNTTIDWSSYNMCNGYLEGAKGHNLVTHEGSLGWYNKWIKD